MKDKNFLQKSIVLSSTYHCIKINDWRAALWSWWQWPIRELPHFIDLCSAPMLLTLIGECYKKQSNKFRHWIYCKEWRYLSLQEVIPPLWEILGKFSLQSECKLSSPYLNKWDCNNDCTKWKCAILIINGEIFYCSVTLKIFCKSIKILFLWIINV